MATAVKVTKFTDENLALLHDAINDALVSVGKKWNVTFTLPPITGSETRVSTQLSLTANTSEGVPEEAANWTDHNLKALRLKKEWLGQTFTYTGRMRRGGKWHTDKYTISGLKPNDKMPVIAIRIRDGEEYRFAAELIRKQFEPEVVFAEFQALVVKDWELYAKKAGLNPAVLGKQYGNAITYKVLGYDSRKPQAPIVLLSNLQRVNGDKDLRYITVSELIAEFPEAQAVAA